MPTSTAIPPDQRFALLRQSFLDGAKEFPNLGHAIIRFAAPSKNICSQARQTRDSAEWRGATSDEWGILLGSAPVTNLERRPFNFNNWWCGEQLGESLAYNFDSAFYDNSGGVNDDIFVEWFNAQQAVQHGVMWVEKPKKVPLLDGLAKFAQLSASTADLLNLPATSEHHVAVNRRWLAFVYETMKPECRTIGVGPDAVLGQRIESVFEASVLVLDQAVTLQADTNTTNTPGKNQCRSGRAEAKTRRGAPGASAIERFTTVTTLARELKARRRSLTDEKLKSMTRNAKQWLGFSTDQHGRNRWGHKYKDNGKTWWELLPVNQQQELITLRSELLDSWKSSAQKK